METPTTTPGSIDPDHVEVAPNRDWHIVVSWLRGVNEVTLDKHDGLGEEPLRRFDTPHDATQWAVGFFTQRGIRYDATRIGNGVIMRPS